MRIVLYLSRHADLDLYAYFRDVEYRKSTHAKQLLRDYIRKQQTVPVSPPRVTADTWSDASLPKKLTIPIRFGQEDGDLIRYFEDIPSGLRAKCAKSILRALLAPYVQCAFHRDPVDIYVPDVKTQPVTRQSPVSDMANNDSVIACTMQTMQMMMQMMMSQQSADIGKTDKKTAVAQPTQAPALEKPVFLQHRPQWSDAPANPPTDITADITMPEIPLPMPQTQTQVQVPEPASQPVAPPPVAEPDNTDSGNGVDENIGGIEGSDNDKLMQLFGADY